MKQNEPGCLFFLLILPFYIIGGGLEILIKIAGSLCLAFTALVWFILSAPLYFLKKLFFGISNNDTEEFKNQFELLGDSLDKLWTSKIILPK